MTAYADTFATTRAQASAQDALVVLSDALRQELLGRPSRAALSRAATIARHMGRHVARLHTLDVPPAFTAPT